MSISSEFNNQLKDINRKVLAIETESGLVFRVCNDTLIPAVTIRGISDNADKNKSLLEESLKKSLRGLAMENACDLLKALFKNVLFLKTAQSHAAGRVEFKTELSEVDKEQGLFTAARKRISDYLEQASADYKHRLIETPLPLPRVRESGTNEDALNFDLGPTSIYDALIQNRRLFVKIPRF